MGSVLPKTTRQDAVFARRRERTGEQYTQSVEIQACLGYIFIIIFTGVYTGNITVQKSI